MFSLIISNGLVVDGTGNPWYRADIGVEGDRITCIGNLSRAKAARRIDAKGQVVAPGFIDIHTHSDLALVVDGRADAHVRQGVTTSVTGNCGTSAAPATEDTLSLMAGIGIGGARADDVEWRSPAVAEYDGMYATHIRGENDTVMEALEEALEIGRRAGVRVQISHLKAMGRHMWGKSVYLLAAIDKARAEGLDVTFDQYPYNASATGLSAVLPPWAQEGGKDEFMRRLRDEESRARMRQDILNGTGDWVSMYKGVGWENILITQCPDPSFEGKSIAQIAEEQGKDGFDACFDLLLEFEGKPRMVYFTIGDEDLERIMRHPAGMVGSDSSASHIEGPLAVGKPHPRAFGTFVRVLGRYVREKKVITLEEAVRRMTSAPAQKLRLMDRGLLRPGMKADIVVFDPDTVADTATYEKPYSYAVGGSGQWTSSSGRRRAYRCFARRGAQEKNVSQLQRFFARSMGKRTQGFRWRILPSRVYGFPLKSI